MDRIVLGVAAWVMVPVTLGLGRAMWDILASIRHERTLVMIGFSLWIAPALILGFVMCVVMLVSFAHAALTGSMLIPGTEINMGRR